MSDDLASELAPHLPSEILRLIAPLFDAEPLPIQELRRQVAAYRDAIQVALKTREWPDMDAELGEACGKGCVELLNAFGRDPTPRQHQLLHLAVRYFVTAEDDEDDLESLVGFDDDAMVVNAVARVLDCPRAVIPLAPR